MAGETLTETVERTIETTSTWAVATVCFFFILISISIEQLLHLLGKGRISLVSREGVQELQYMIFILAVFHVFSSVLTFSLGVANMKKWESWEVETRTLEYQYTSDPRRFQLTHQTSFGKHHMKFWSDHSILRWPACFLRQFNKSVSRADYLTLRHGFITAHFVEGCNFDFQKYIRRALEKDFGVIVGISWWIWLCSLLFIFFHAHMFHNYLWLPFFPLVTLLLVGTKLQGIITKMCLDSHKKSHVVRGTLLVRPSDHFFWFGRPKLLLQLIHFVLFQNSFQLAFFSWTWVRYGFRSCFHQENEDIVIKIATGILVQFLCGYVTLPLYALVAQMGSSMGSDFFTEGVINSLKYWRKKAKKELALRNRNYSARPSLDASLDTSLTTSSFHTIDATLSPESGRASDVDFVDEEKLRGRQPEEKQRWTCSMTSTRLALKRLYN